MSLNIKSEVVHDLARRLADVTGTSMTSAVEDALRARLAQIESEGGRARLLAELHAFQETITDQDRAEVWAYLEDLYDDDGLPL